MLVCVFVLMWNLLFVYMWFFGNVVLWKCVFVYMWFCGNVDMLKCGFVDLWKCGFVRIFIGNKKYADACYKTSAYSVAINNNQIVMSVVSLFHSSLTVMIMCWLWL